MSSRIYEVIKTSDWSWQIYKHHDAKIYVNYFPNIIYKTEEAALNKAKELNNETT